MINKEEEKKDFVSTVPYRIATTAGATASILAIVFFASLLDILPKEAEGIIISMGLFISLPLVFSFIFGLIANKPNFTQTIRHYGFGVYLIITLVIYFLYLRPDSFMLFGKLLVQFFIGFILAFIAGLFYFIPHHFLRKKQYRTKASTSFGISFVLTLSIIFILKYYNIFEMII